MQPNNRTSASIFISYSRANADFARDLYERLTTLGFSLWRDRTEMAAGEDWWQQIQEAIQAVDTMVLVLSPQALESPIVTKEWRYARQLGTRVIPVVGASVDFKRVPRWAGKLDWLDFRESAPERELIWNKFLTQIKSSYQRARVPFTPPDLPERFVPRPSEFELLLGALLDSTQENPRAATVILKGGGGFGKTSLALSVCHDERIQAAFDGGVLWVALGEQPNLVGLITDQIKVLTGESAAFSDLITAMARLKELLENRDMLLVLDDVWDESHTRPFLNGGPNCARLITTRRQDVAARLGGSTVDIAQMKTSESARMLINWLESPPADPRPFEVLARDLGDWPLMVRLAGAYLHEATVIDQQSLDEALTGLRRRLERRGFTAFDRADEGQRSRAISISLEVSMSRLGKWRDRYLELAVFPEDANIPFEVIGRLWHATVELDDLDTEDALKAIHRLSLFNSYDPAHRTIQLHDVIRAYLGQQQGEKLPSIHAALLNSYNTGRWALLPVGSKSNYLWHNLSYHLLGANRNSELISTVEDIYFLANKSFLLGGFDAEKDLVATEEIAPEDKTVRVLRRNFANMGHLFAQLNGVNEIAATMHSRLCHLSELADLTAKLEKDLKPPYLTAWHRLPDLPHPSLLRTLSGHTDDVTDCAISPDGKFIVSASRDETLKIWDIAQGAEWLTLRSHHDWVGSCAVSPSGDKILSVSQDGTLILWDMHTGEQRLTLNVQKWATNICALSDDAIVCAESDGMLKAWDSRTGDQRFAIRAHKLQIKDCVISPSGNLIVTASSDTTLKVWDAETGEERFTLSGHKRRVNACAINDELIVSASLDGTIKLWDVNTGAEKLALDGNDGEVTDCAISPSGEFIISTGWNGTLKLWDVASGSLRLNLSGHTHRINACAISPIGDLIVTAASDGMLKLWDGGTLWLAGRLKLGAMLSDYGWMFNSLDATQDLLQIGSQLASYGGEVRACAISPVDNWAVSAANDGTLKTWDLATGAEQTTLVNDARHLSACAVSPSGDLIICAPDNTLKVWEKTTGAVRFTLTGHTDLVRGCAVSPDGTWIVSASHDHTLVIWDLRTGAKLRELIGHSDGIDGCAVSPAGDFIVSAGWDKTLKIWDASSGREIRTLSGHTDIVRSCAVSPDGTWIVSASRDETLKIWDFQSGSERLTLSGHTADVRGCAISPDGSWIASASRDDTLKVWDSQSGQCLATLAVNGRLYGCVSHPNGRHIVAAGSGGVYFIDYTRL